VAESAHLNVEQCPVSYTAINNLQLFYSARFRPPDTYSTKNDLKLV